MPPIRGSWTVDEAVALQWERNNLDKKFRDEWSDPADTNYEPLHDGEARPTHPRPYCVYEKSEPVLLGHMTGSNADPEVITTENQLQEVTIQFTIHAKNRLIILPSGEQQLQSGKRIAKRLAEKVDEAFGPENALPFKVDKHVVTVRGPDWHIREGDEEWAWVLSYILTIDCEYDKVA